MIFELYQSKENNQLIIFLEYNDYFLIRENINI